MQKLIDKQSTENWESISLYKYDYRINEKTKKKHCRIIQRPLVPIEDLVLTKANGLPRLTEIKKKEQPFSSI